MSSPRDYGTVTSGDWLTSYQVFTNKAIFSDPSLKLAQLTFASFHFFITWLTLFTLSRPRFAMFVPRRVAIKEIIPLAIAMSMNVILPNLSLAFSTVTFYQVARILLTPTVALMNFVLYRATLPRNAIYALVPACLGVGMVSYYDSLPSGDETVKTTSGLGILFAFTGIFASSLYTVWIASYHKKLQMNSMQLLYNQAPVSAFMLLYVIPFIDTFPVWSEVPFNRWAMIMMVSNKLFPLPFRLHIPLFGKSTAPRSQIRSGPRNEEANISYHCRADSLPASLICHNFSSLHRLVQCRVLLSGT